MPRSNYYKGKPTKAYQAKQDFIPSKPMFAKKVKNLEVAVKHLKKVDKMNDVTDTSQPGVYLFSTTGDIHLLNPAMAAKVYSGSGSNYNYCLASKFDMRGLILQQQNQTHADPADDRSSSQLIRIVIFRDLDNDHVLPSVTGDEGLFETASIISHYNIKTQKRFKIVSDRVIKLEPPVVHAHTTAGPATANVTLGYKCVKKYKDLEMTYVDDAAAVASCEKNQFFLFMIIDNIPFDGTAYLNTVFIPNTQMQFDNVKNI